MIRSADVTLIEPDLEERLMRKTITRGLGLISHSIYTFYCNINGQLWKDPSLSIKITDQKKEIYFHCDPIKSVESHITMLTNYAKLWCDVIHKKSEITIDKKAIDKKEIAKKDGMTVLPGLHQKRDHLMTCVSS